MRTGVQVMTTSVTVINWLADFWNGWSTQFLVLLSLALQVLLLFLAGVRRHTDKGLKIWILWVAYQLADYTTTYALGNLGASSTRREHQLVAFWVPFLLLHLAGPDNIAAYELEDNKLWGRHILTLAAQGLGAGYVLYKHISGSSWTSFSVATIFMAGVGFVKSIEKTLALRNASLKIVRDSVRAETPGKSSFFLEYEESRLWGPKQGYNVAQQEELLKQHAHALFRVCKSAMVDSSVGGKDDDPNRSSSHQPDRLLRGFSKKGEQHLLQQGSKDHQDMPKYKWKLIEMELSFMYDFLYTKAAMVYKLRGYIIRAASWLVVAASLLLFVFSGKAGLSTADVVITYVLLAGALLLETTSLLNALFSSWTFAFLSTTRSSQIRHALLCSRRWNQLRRVFVALQWLASGCVRIPRDWHGTMRQCSILDRSSRWGNAKPLAGRWAQACSLLLPSSSVWTISVPDMVRECVEDHIKLLKKDNEINTLGLIRKNWGDLEDEEYSGRFIGTEVQEGIVVWHIATDILLTNLGKLRTTTKNAVETDDAAGAIKAISQYMMFLLLKRPDMLPGLAQIKLYQRTENTLAGEWEGFVDRNDKSDPASVSRFIHRIYTTVMELYGRGPNSDARLRRRQELAERLLSRENDLGQDQSGIKSRVRFGVALAKQLIKRKEDSLQIVLDMWTDILVYTANRCSRESHAKQLGQGGEFTTVVWLMLEHYHQTEEPKSESRWNQLRRVFVALQWLASGCVRIPRDWHGTMGQCSILDRSSRWGNAKPLAGRWAQACSLLLPSSSVWTISVPDMVRECVEDHIKYMKEQRAMNTLGVIRETWGQVAQSRHEDFKMDKDYLGAEVQEGIVIWHIATDILLADLGKLRTAKNTVVEADDAAGAIKAISQYMMFLLLKRPAMLPGLAQIKLYRRVENTLAGEWKGVVGNNDKSDAAPAALSPAMISWFIRRFYTTVMELHGRGPNSDSRLQRRQKLAKRLLGLRVRDEENQLRWDEFLIKSRVIYGIDLAKQLIRRQKEKEDSLEIVLDVTGGDEKSPPEYIFH
ncbi:hypothetical protein U9M48_020754 [Paspalum notatum var. saurae]|uniref:DUF4220 domain-containing protein n=1 Tax=Paspalum notatum var. saurae TaxID=547442 RepID=A0AAQ3WSS2_PASNO